MPPTLRHAWRRLAVTLRSDRRRKELQGNSNGDVRKVGYNIFMRVTSVTWLEIPKDAAFQFIKEWLASGPSRVIIVKRFGRLFFKAPGRGRLGKMPLAKGTCQHCGKRFSYADTKVGRRRKFCSSACAGMYRSVVAAPRIIQLWNDGMAVTDIGREVNLSRQRIFQVLAANEGSLNQPLGRRRTSLRARLDRVCAWCGKTYQGVGDSKYCSRACVMAHSAEVYPTSQYRVYKLICAGCGIEFERSGRLKCVSDHSNNNSGRYYCSLPCFRKNRLSKVRAGK